MPPRRSAARGGYVVQGAGGCISPKRREGAPAMLEDLLPDVIEIVEHIAYSHSFRTEGSQKRVSELLASIRTRLLDALEQKKAAATPAEPAAAPVPTPADTSAPSATASPVSAPAAASGEASVPVADASAGTPGESPVISQPEPTA